MAYKQDYILRLAEQFAKIVGYLLGLLKEEKFLELDQTIQQSWKDYLNLESGIGDHCSNADILRLFAEQNAGEDQWELASDLLYLEGMMHAKSNPDKAKIKLNQSVFILKELEKRSSRNYSLSRTHKINDRLQLISTLTCD